MSIWPLAASRIAPTTRAIRSANLRGERTPSCIASASATVRGLRSTGSRPAGLRLLVAASMGVLPDARARSSALIASANRPSNCTSESGRSNASRMPSIDGTDLTIMFRSDGGMALMAFTSRITVPSRALSSANLPWPFNLPSDTNASVSRAPHAPDCAMARMMRACTPAFSSASDRVS